MIFSKNLIFILFVFASTLSFGQNLVRAVELKNEAQTLHEKGNNAEALDKILEAKTILNNEGRDIPESMKALEKAIRKEIKSAPKKPDVDPKKTDDDEVIFQVVEEMPSFPGGRSALNRYLSSNLNYPEAAINADIQGTVYIGFIVDEYGALRDISVLKSVNILLDNEAIRVVEAMPTWEPGRQRGKNVRVKYTLPITFRLN